MIRCLDCTCMAIIGGGIGPCSSPLEFQVRLYAARNACKSEKCGGGGEKCPSAASASPTDISASSRKNIWGYRLGPARPNGFCPSSAEKNFFKGYRLRLMTTPSLAFSLSLSLRRKKMLGVPTWAYDYLGYHLSSGRKFVHLLSQILKTTLMVIIVITQHSM